MFILLTDHKTQLGSSLLPSPAAVSGCLLIANKLLFHSVRYSVSEPHIPAGYKNSDC